MFRLSALFVVALTATFLPVSPTVAQQPAAGALPAKGKKIAVLVGVNDYTNRKLTPLRYAEADVTDLAEVLKAAGFQVRLLRGSAEGPDEANKANIEASLTKTFQEVGRHDTLLLAFSGHGQQLFLKAGGPDEKEKEVPFYCPKDAVPTDPVTLISLSAVLKRLDEKGGRTNLLLVDACRNVVDPNRGARGGVDGNKVENLGEGTAAFFACTGRQRAMETDKAGGGHGVFFHFVLEGLKGAPGTLNGDGQVTWDRLVPFVKEQVTRHTPTWFDTLPEAEHQRPHAIGNLAADPILTTPSVDSLVAADFRAVVEVARAGNGVESFYKSHAATRLGAWRRAAEAGVPAGMYFYGGCLSLGLEGERDEAQAVMWYRKAAAAGNSNGMSNLGFCYQRGIGVEKDEKQAAAWFRKAAEAGNSTAMANLGICYANGIGVERDERQAIRWYREAATAGNGLGMSNVGLCYAHGNGVEKDEKQAVAWYRKAAEAGNGLGLFNLALVYEQGRGVEKDEKQAVAWYRKAAEAGNERAMTGLGVVYERGSSVEKNEKQAVAWYRKAADKGEPYAMLNLGLCYAYARGVEKNTKEATAWFRKSYRQAVATGNTKLAAQAKTSLAELGEAP